MIECHVVLFHPLEMAFNFYTVSLEAASFASRQLILRTDMA